ncbi:MAG: Rieske (2Fe-2S) protein [Alphaproteobacteria bacterium]|nr:Rieske (2Fe-2S) protein [Alphaproteobacteria bacterium]
MARHVVASLGEIAPGDCKIVTVQGREIGVFNVGGEHFALINRCPHEGAPLCRGVLVGLAESDRPGQFRLVRQGEMLRCPWHGWEFDIRTGQSWCDPDSVRARSYAVTVEPGETLAKGPFVAETVPVSVEREYVVVEV